MNDNLISVQTTSYICFIDKITRANGCFRFAAIVMFFNLGVFDIIKEYAKFVPVVRAVLPGNRPPASL